MQTKFTKTLLAFCLATAGSFKQPLSAQYCTPPPAGCSNVDISNSFLNSSDPNTIEYDNIVSTFHGTVARKADGSVVLWGENMGYGGSGSINFIKNLDTVGITGYKFTGNLLKFTGGSYNGQPPTGKAWNQYVVLTTTGLYAWGGEGNLIDSSLTTSKMFQKLTIDGQVNGLPSGVNPVDVKMLFGTTGMLGLVTCDGAVWTLVNPTVLEDMRMGAIWSTYHPNAENAFGDNSTASSSTTVKWHRVKTNASNNFGSASDKVVAIRGCGNYTFMALKADGTLWTWGRETYLGDGSTAAPRAYATQMSIALNSGAKPKMIAMNGTAGEYGPFTSYHVLSTDGYVYSLGDNSKHQLGDFTGTTRTSWVRALKSATPANNYIDNIAWISSTEHDGLGLSAINALRSDGDLWSWGTDSESMLGGGSGASFYNFIDPTNTAGGLTGTDKLMAVETGGHTTIVVKKCDGKFGYVGHKINGSMATSGSGTETNYTFNTGALDLCGAPAIAHFITPNNTSIFAGTPFATTVNHTGGTFSIVSGSATVNATGLVTATAAGNVIVKYATGDVDCPTEDLLTLVVNVPTPVKLIYFSAQKENRNTALLYWATSSEQNNKGFELEKSTDGKVWNKIAFVASKADNGNSNIRLEYSFTDLQTTPGCNQYRLKQADADGHYEYSPVQTLYFAQANGISIHPNPSTDFINITGLQGGEQLKVYDAMGRLLINQKAGNKTECISLSNFSEGLYYIYIIDHSGNTSPYKIVKTNR